MIITILSITIFILIIISTILFIRGFSMVKKMERMEDILIRYEDTEEETKQVLILMLQQMRDVDIRGSFEADDEVGSVFKELKLLIEKYSNI